jgi:hypothetical protein
MSYASIRPQNLCLGGHCSRWRVRFGISGRKEFSLILIIFACNLGTIPWRFDCPHLKYSSRHRHNRAKRYIIVEKKEIDVAKYFPQDEVFGLYSGHDGIGNQWSNNFTHWNKLRDEKSFPAMKNSNMK